MEENNTTKHSDYKGHQIEVDADGKWTATKDGSQVAIGNSLDEVKKAIDKISKAQLGNQEVIIHYNGRLVNGKVTSVKHAQHSYSRSRFAFRVTTPTREGHSWDDLEPTSIYKDTPENKAKMTEYNQTKDQVEALTRKMEKIHKSLEAYTEKELLGE